MNFDEWYAKNADVFPVFDPRSQALIAWEASKQAHANDERANTDAAVEQAYSELHTERMALHSALRLVADLRAALGDDGKRMQPELIEYARGLEADAARWRDFQSDAPMPTPTLAAEKVQP